MAPVGRTAAELERLVSCNPHIDIFRCLTYFTWSNIFMEPPTKRGEARVAGLARTAAQHNGGRLLPARYISDVLRVIGSTSKKKESYVARIVALLRIMLANGWDMYCDDYAKAALPCGTLFDAILEMDRQRQRHGGRSSDGDVSDAERSARFAALLREAATQQWHSSIPKILQVAGSGYVNVPLDSEDRTVIHCALDMAVVDEAVAAEIDADPQGRRRARRAQPSVIPKNRDHCIELPAGYVDMLVSHKPSDLRTKSKGYSYLHLAAKFCADSDILSVLMDLVPGVDINATDSQGNTALHYLCQRRKVALARFAASKGADPVVRNSDGKYPADLLREAQQLDAENPASKLLEVPASLCYPGLQEAIAAEKARSQPGADEDDGGDVDVDSMDESDDGDTPQARPKQKSAASSAASAASAKKRPAQGRGKGKRKRTEEVEGDDGDKPDDADAGDAAPAAADAAGRKRRKTQR